MGYVEGPCLGAIEVPEAVPKCPRCGWTLSFEAIDRSWVARCWNKPNPPSKPLGCPVDVVPPTINYELLAYVKEHEPVTSPEVADWFMWSVPNANNHLQTLRSLGLVKRYAINPIKGGKMFAWTTT